MLYPMSAMVLLILIIGILTLKARIDSVKTGQVKTKIYKLMQGNEFPETVIKTSRNFNNLFEIPMLFFISCLLYIILEDQSLFGIITAWIFVITRYIHSYIHLTYNHIFHRLLVFCSGIFCILALWVNLLIRH